MSSFLSFLHDNIINCCQLWEPEVRNIFGSSTERLLNDDGPLNSILIKKKEKWKNPMEIIDGKCNHMRLDLTNCRVNRRKLPTLRSSANIITEQIHYVYSVIRLTTIETNVDKCIR